MPQGEEEKMIPSWLKSTAKAVGPDLFAEFLGVMGIKNLLKKGREKVDEVVSGTAGKTEEKPEVKHGGLFTLQDEEDYFELMGQISKKDAIKISAFLRMYLEPWQQRRFRASVGSLAEIILPAESEWMSLKKSEFTKEYSQKQNETAAGKETRTEYEQKEKKKEGAKINLGVKFLKSFAKCNEEEMLDICEASGVMHSDLEAIKKAWEKLETWADTQGPTITKNINVITERLELSAGAKLATKLIKPPKRPYPGFFKAFIGLK